jgi:hypothetical protein
MKYIPNFRPVKLMSDAAPAIFNGLSEIYPTMKQGKYYFHVMKNLRDRQYTDSIEKNKFLSDLRSLSKSHNQVHFDCSVHLFLKKYVDHIDNSISDTTAFFQKFWLAERNKGWHSGLVPGTVTTNNGLEVTNRVFKKNFKGMSNFHCYFLYQNCRLYFLQSTNLSF